MLHAHTTHLRCHSRRQTAEIPLLTDEPRVNHNVLQRHSQRLARNASTNKYAGNVGGSFHIFALNCGINSKCVILSCATIAFSELYLAQFFVE